MALEISNLNKTYANGVRALQGVNLSIEKGMFGLLGPNGAGKSSLMRTIATLQDADQGEIQFNNIDIKKHPFKIREILGYLPQEFGVYPKISAFDLLDYLVVLKGITNSRERKQRVGYFLELTNLTASMNKSVATFSGGMKQRFGIAQALIGQPELLIVDEPTAGLDPEERLRFYNILSEVGSDVTVILSTHIVSDVADLCSKFAIINCGQVKVTLSPDQAIQQIEGKIWSTLTDKAKVPQLNETYQVINTRFSAGKTIVKVFSDSPIPGFEATQPTLEDFYFSTIKGFVR